MKKILFLLAVMFFHCSVLTVMAQPQRSRVQNNRNTTRRNNTTGRVQKTTPAISRADLMFPTAVAMPEEVVWRRDLYRSLDLKEDANAALYYPVQPQGKQVNLFTLLFRLFSTGKLPVYEYNLDGFEDFSPEKRMHFKDFLEKYSIYYELQGNTYKIDDADIPSAEVLRYYVKESSYYDQNTATYHSRVTAICPVLMRSDFGDELTPYPLFWVKYDDVATYLSGHMVMTSNVNNAAKMSSADFFATNHYKGKIYLTNNMQGKSLQEMVVADSTGNKQAGLAKAQDKIEKEMADFEKHIWTTPVDSAELARRDSIAKLQMKKKVVVTNTRRGQTSTGNATVQNSTKKEKAPKSSSSGPRISARRQRH